MEYYYPTSNDQNYPLNQPYNDYYNYNYNDHDHDHDQYGVSNYSNGCDPNTYDQPTHDYHNYNYNYNCSSYDQDQYGVADYSNDYGPNPYDQHTQFHINPYEHFPAQSMVVYQSYDHPLDELPAKKGSNFLDPISTNGFVISYSNTESKPDLELEEFDLHLYRGGYSIEETYGKALPPSADICYPPSKLINPSPPFGQGSESKEDEDDEEEEEEEENRGVLVALPLPVKEDQEEEEEEENRGVLVALPLPVKEDQEEKDAEEESSSDESEEMEEEEEEKAIVEVEKVKEKEVKGWIPTGYGLGSMDICEGVFGGYFPCLRKKLQQNQVGNSGCKNEDMDGWKTTMDYLFGDPDPYARALPDPIYGYNRYHPQQPISGQIAYVEDHSWMVNSSFYNYGPNYEF